MANHLLCMEYLAEKQNIEKLKEYLTEMRQQMTQIQKKGYSTGNQILDVLTNHYLSLVDEKTEVQMKGRITEKIQIEQMILCTGYGNLLKNAVEELERAETGKKLLFIEFLQGAQYVQINIRNTISEKTIGKKSLLASVKEDKRNHGIVLQNINRAVKECDGELIFGCDREFFKAQVILKNEGCDRSRTYMTT